MNDTGIHRKLDGPGRLVFPVELRKMLALDKGTAMAFFTLHRHEKGCVFCGGAKDLIGFSEHEEYHHCIAQLPMRAPAVADGTICRRLARGHCPRHRSTTEGDVRPWLASLCGRQAPEPPTGCQPAGAEVTWPASRQPGLRKPSVALLAPPDEGQCHPEIAGTYRRQQHPADE